MVYEQLIETAFSEANGSHGAEALLADRGWLKSRIHQECAALQLTITESAELENDLLPLFGQEEAVLPGLVQVLDQIKPMPSAPTQGVQE